MAIFECELPVAYREEFDFRFKRRIKSNIALTAEFQSMLRANRQLRNFGNGDGIIDDNC